MLPRTSTGAAAAASGTASQHAEAAGLIEAAKRLRQLLCSCGSYEDLQACEEAASITDVLFAPLNALVNKFDSASQEAAFTMTEPELLQLLLQSYGRSLQLLAMHTVWSYMEIVHNLRGRAAKKFFLP
jgi:hypothetical protein